MNPGVPTGQQLAWRLKAGFPARTRSLRWRICSRAQGWRIGALRSPMANTACAPVERTSLLEDCRCPGAAVTGPGPLGGGRSRTPAETHPTDGLGAKSGWESAPAPNAKFTVNASTLKIAVMTDDSFDTLVSPPVPDTGSARH